MYIPAQQELAHHSEEKLSATLASTDPSLAARDVDSVMVRSTAIVLPIRSPPTE